MSRKLWPHQTRAIEALRASLRARHKRPVLQLPTGAGKTIISAAMIRSALERSDHKRVVFTCPAISLIDQTAQSFWDEGIRDIGVIQAQHVMTDASRRVQIASVQTLANRQFPEDVCLVINDECHRKFQSMIELMSREDLASVPFIGLSATPWSRGLGQIYDDLVIGATMGELIKVGVLSPYRYFAPFTPDLKGVRTTTNTYGERDYVEADVARVMNSDEIVANVVETWLEKAEDRPTLVFAVNRAHAAHLAGEFEGKGVACGYVDMDTTTDERATLKRRFHSGDIRIVCSVGTMTTGVDWDVRCVVLARALKSEILYVQMIGRGLRRAAGKKDCLVLDHGGVALGIGKLPHEIHYAGLNMGKLDLADDKTESQDEADPGREKKVKQCPKCDGILSHSVYVCPHCGFKGGEHGVRTLDGALAEVTSVTKAKKANREVTWEEKQAFAAALKRYALDHNKPDAWFSHRYRDKFDVWPNDPRVRHVSPAASVEPHVASWIRSRNIAYAKSKARGPDAA